MKKKLLSVLTVMILAMSLILPVQAGDDRQRMVDQAGLLSQEERQTLEETLDEISERQQMDVVVVTVNWLEGRTATEYADDFFDYNGYGFGSDHDGILLLVSMSERNWAISTCGYGITAFTDVGNKYLEKRIVGKLSDGKYYKAFTVFAEECDRFIDQAKTGEPFDIHNSPKRPMYALRIVLSICGGFLIAFLIALRKKAKLRSIIQQRSATEYIEPGSMELTVNEDRFINRVTTTRKIERSSRSGSGGGSRGGSSTHRSSSGRSHGGSSGRF